MDGKIHVKVPHRALVAFCHRNHIHRLAFFGSVLRDDFRAKSDVDVLVEFKPGHIPGFLGMASMELELGKLLNGRKVDLNTPGCFRPALREKVLSEAMVCYGKAG